MSLRTYDFMNTICYFKVAVQQKTVVQSQKKKGYNYFDSVDNWKNSVTSDGHNEL